MAAVATRAEVIDALGIAETLAESPSTYVADHTYRQASSRIDSIVEQVTELNYGIVVKALTPWLPSSDGVTACGGGRFSGDLLTVAMTALYESFVSWDPEGDSKFASWFCNYKFKEAMNLFVGVGSNGWPRRLTDSKKRIDLAIADLELTLQRKPSNEEIVEELGWAPSAVAVIEVLQRTDIRLDKHIGSDNTPGETRALHEILSEDDVVDTDASSNGLAPAHVERLLGNPALSPLDVFITIRRSGLGGFSSQSLAALANDTGIGRESLRRNSIRLEAKLDELAKELS